MEDVARRLGVHVSTVSRALRECSGVSAGVRRQVRKTAADLGYRANPLISALIRSRRNPNRKNFHATLGVLIPRWPDGHRAYQRDYESLLEGARARAADFGYRLESLPLGPDEMPPGRLAEILSTRMIAGLVLPPLHESAELIALDWRHWPLVAIGYSQRIPVPRVVHDHMHALRLAVEQCRKAGRGRIGLVLPQRVSDKVENRWLAAFLLESRGSRSLVPPLLLDDQSDHQSFAHWRRKYRPDAIVGLPHLVKIEQWLSVDSLNVPRDVGLVSLDCRPTGVKYAGIDQEYPDLGGMAVEILVSLVERRVPSSRQPAITMMRGSWRSGRSL